MPSATTSGAIAVQVIEEKASAKVDACRRRN
jgi:hypothetical protein